MWKVLVVVLRFCYHHHRPSNITPWARLCQTNWARAGFVHMWSYHILYSMCAIYSSRFAFSLLRSKFKCCTAMEQLSSQLQLQQQQQQQLEKPFRHLLCFSFCHDAHWVGGCQVCEAEEKKGGSWRCADTWVMNRNWDMPLSVLTAKA